MDTIIGSFCLKKHLVCIYYTFDSSGYWVNRYDNGKTKEKGHFRRDKKNDKENRGMVKVGIWRYYNENGSLARKKWYGRGSLFKD
ncbi:MAG: hypothetical protein K1X26_11225 [Chitinophagales bacterium]|jgi:antitoxin component YwqK of YwqJK toxin-antitoxin module|nr:hypothetical protein [Chitinophagales bacterium]HNL07981.1 hypothetical protein [Chitinophagales bacterium]